MNLKRFISNIKLKSKYLIFLFPVLNLTKKTTNIFELLIHKNYKI
jgi:hypothetical protein